MSFPALENGPYIFNVNIDCVEGNITNKAKRMLLELKNALVGLGGANTIWTVVASSDATDFVNKGGSEPLDLWDSIADVSYGTGAHSWCILENLTTHGELLIDWYTSAYYQGEVCKYSPGGLFTDTGTASVAPTATDSRSLIAGSAAFVPYAEAYNSFVLHVMTSADHKTTRFFLNDRAQGTAHVGVWCGLIEEVVDAPSQWTSTNKVMVLTHYLGVSQSAEPKNQWPNLAQMDDAYWSVYLETAEPYAGWIRTYCTAFCYDAVGSASFQGRPVMLADSTGEFPASPIGLYSTSTGIHSGSFGRLRDIYFGHDLHKTLTTYPGDGSGDWIKFGCLVVPWDGSVPVPVHY